MIVQCIIVTVQQAMMVDGDSSGYSHIPQNSMSYIDNASSVRLRAQLHRSCKFGKIPTRGL